MIVKMIVVCCFVARSFGMNNNTSVHEFESRVHAETAHTSLEKHTIDVGCLEMNELQKKHIYIYMYGCLTKTIYSFYGGTGCLFCNFQSHSKMFMIWSLTTGTDGDHKRWMKHLAMNLHVRRRSLYVCIYMYIHTFFDWSTHAGGTHNIPVNSDPDASFTFR